MHPDDWKARGVYRKINGRKRHRERWVDALLQSCVPVALINGSADPVSGAHMVARYKELDLPLAWLEELPTIGHYPRVESPGAVSESYLKFVDSVEGSFSARP